MVKAPFRGSSILPQKLLSFTVNYCNIQGSDGNYSVKLIDFGAAQDLAEENYEKNQYKRGFAPIEQYQNETELIGPWTDVYAVCATIYWLLSQKRLPDASNRSDNDKVYSLQEIGVFVPRKLEKILEKGLAYSPQKRIDSVGKLRKMLQQVPTNSYVISWVKASVLAVAFAGLLAYTTWLVSASNFEEYRNKREETMAIETEMMSDAFETSQESSESWNTTK